MTLLELERSAARLVELGPKNAVPWLLNTLYFRRKEALRRIAWAKRSYKTEPMVTAVAMLIEVDREIVLNLEEMITTIEAMR